MLLLIIVLNIIGGSACISSDVLTGMKGPALILFFRLFVEGPAF